MRKLIRNLKRDTERFETKMEVKIHAKKTDCVGTLRRPR